MVEVEVGTDKGEIEDKGENEERGEKEDRVIGDKEDKEDKEEEGVGIEKRAVEVETMKSQERKKYTWIKKLERRQLTR